MAGLQDLKQSFAAPKLDDVEGHWSKAVPSHVEEADKVVTSVQKERAELQRERDEIEAMRNEVMKSKAPQFDRPAEENPARGDDSRDDVTETDDDPQLAVPESTELGFLTNPPSRPRIPVMINLGTGGSHLKRFHHVTTRDIWLSLIFDSRYEGDQFIPPVTKEGEPPIQVTFPDSGNQTIQCVVPESCNMRIGCMDIINFLIVQPENTPEEPTQDEFAQHNDFKHLVPEGLLKAAGK